MYLTSSGAGVLGTFLPNLSAALSWGIVAGSVSEPGRNQVESGESAARSGMQSFFFEVVSFQTANRPATGLWAGLRSVLWAGKPGFRGVQTQSKAGFSPGFFAGLGWFVRGFKTTV